jgi:hypothetical protein
MRIKQDTRSQLKYDLEWYTDWLVLANILFGHLLLHSGVSEFLRPSLTALHPLKLT